MVLKQCPKCNKQVPVACKSCPCGHSYAKGRLGTASSSSADAHLIDESGVANTVKRRRTERIQRAKALADRLAAAQSTGDRQVRRRSRRVPTSSATVDVSTPKRRLRGRRKSRNVQLSKGPPKRGRSDSRGQHQHQQKKMMVADVDPPQNEEDDDEEAAIINVSPEASLRYSIILDEINRKIGINYSPFN